MYLFSDTIADTTGAVLVDETPERGLGVSAESWSYGRSSETMADTTGAVLVDETSERDFVVSAEPGDQERSSETIADTTGAVRVDERNHKTMRKSRKLLLTLRVRC